MIKNIFFALFIVISINNSMSMDKKPTEQHILNHQHMINDEAKQQLENAIPTEYVSISPYANLEYKVAATKHNLQVTLHNKKKGKK